MFLLAALPAVSAAAPPNVILVTLDGVRREDLRDRRLFPWFWKHATGRGVLGDIAVSNPFRVSLPGYQSILAGAVQPCRGNRCGRVRAETLLERLRKSLGLSRHDVAVISSWRPMALAAARDADAVYVSAGVGAPRGEADPELRRIAKAQRRRRPPWKHARYDAFTFAWFKRYVRKHRPRLTMLSFLDSDQLAHRRNKRGYERALKRYDGWLKELFAFLEELGPYGRDTTVIVTTDHGRGRGRAWARHGRKLRTSAQAWLYATGPCTRRGGRLPSGYSHVHIRPTIEALFGLSRCTGCGPGMPEVSGCARRALLPARTPPAL